MIVSKLCGQLVQGDKTGDKSLLDEIKAFIKIRDKKPGNVFLGLVHRIDRPTSGLVIYAKTSKALSRMTEMIRNRKIKKNYWAIVPKADNPPHQRLEHHLKKNERTNRATVFDHPGEGTKNAVLVYTRLSELDTYQLLEIDLETGRHHQIRAQLARIKLPIKGDLKYGAPRSNKDGGIHLHAHSLEFVHPVTKTKIKIIAPVPKDSIWKAAEKSLNLT